MTDKHPLLQDYYDFHDAMMDEERGQEDRHAWWWTQAYGLYKVARYNAVRAGLIPETPQFDEVVG